MDDTRLESDAYPQNENKELSVLQAIIEDGSCDVSTQTKNICSASRVTQFIPPENNGINIKDISHRPRSRSKRSSFKLFIVPDDPDSGAFHDSGLRLSFDEKHHGSYGQSLRFSVTSNECDGKNESTEPLHDSKNIKKNKRSIHRKGADSSVYLEEGNKSDAVDNRLMHSTNPSVIAWLKLKNFEEREKRRLKKQEKKELRRHAYEEAEKRQKCIEESEKHFTQWLTAKKKEARHKWREKRLRTRVHTVENENTIRKDNDPPPNYTAVPTFKGTQAWAGGNVSLHTERTSKNTNRKSSNNELETDNVLKYQDNITAEPSLLLQAQLKTDTQKLSTNGNMAENSQSDQASLHKDNGENYNKRPATADSRLLPVSDRSSKLSETKIQGRRTEQGSNNKRPSTSGGRLTSNTDTMVDKEIKGITYEAWMVQKQKEQKSKRPTTAHASHLNLEDGKKPTKKSITFEAWKEQKQQERKEKSKQKKREIVDDALTETILKMAKKRVENSCKEKRRLDTGMPKWQARNRVRSTSGEKNASILNTSHSKYAVIQLLGKEVNEHENHETLETGTHANDVLAIQKSCENLKLE